MQAQMTEAQAKEKWCPMQRHSEQGVGGAYNRPSDGGFGCIASECMMWRWIKCETPTLNENVRGFCGIAGKPWDAA